MIQISVYLKNVLILQLYFYNNFDALILLHSFFIYQTESQDENSYNFAMKKNKYISTILNMHILLSCF